jgi:PKD repeat protein
MKRLSLSFAMLLLVTMAMAQKSWVGFTSAQPEEVLIDFLKSDHSGLTLEITVPGMYLQQLSVQGNLFHHISLMEGQTTKDVGRPELPMINEVIGIPHSRKLSWKITAIETMKFPDYLIFPFQTPTTDNAGAEKPPFVIDEAFYQKDAPYPAENLIISPPQIWRDVKLANFHFTPFTYNAATGDLTVITKLEVEIIFDEMDEAMHFTPRMELTPKFYNMYSAAIPNFDQLGYSITFLQGTGIKYLVITNPEAIAAIEPLVAWKNEMGHRTEVRILEPGFNTPQEFKDYIQQLYLTDGLEYVLMVGDAYPNGGSGGGPNIVPMYYWNPGSDASYSDSWYTCLDGPDDHYADLAIGRFVYDVNQLSQLETQIQKTMTHYLAPDVADNWAENTILIAHKEEYPGKYTQCCNEIAAYPYSVQVPIFEKAYGGENYSNAQVVNFVNTTGVGIFNYRGHGSSTELWHWTNVNPISFTNSDVVQLTNFEQLFVFFDVCCDNMNIITHPGDCLCESFMKHSGGSVAVNGAIIPSYTIPNHDYDKEMYKAVFDQNITNIGYVTNYANITVLNFHGEIGKSNVRTYLWLGDASAEPWTNQPDDLSVTHSNQLFLGSTDFPVSVLGNAGAVENAMVCISNEDQSIYAVGYTDAGGSAMISFEEPVTIAGNVAVTVTRNNYLPYQAIIPVIAQDGPYVVKDGYLINDNAGGNGNSLMDYAESILLTLAVKNVGTEVAENVTVTLSTDDEFITITDDNEFYDTVEPDEILSIEDGFAFDVAEEFPDGHSVLFNVSATNGIDVWNSYIVIPGHAPEIKMSGLAISDPDGNNNGKLDPGETVTFIITVENSGAADAYNVFGNLSCIDPYVQIITVEPQPCGDIAAGENQEIWFTVAADLLTPQGHATTFTLQTDADFNIAGSDDFNVYIGQIPVVIIDLDGNNNSGPAILDAMTNIGLTAEYITTMPEDLAIYSSAFVCLGIYSSNHVLSASDGQKLADFLNLGGRLYMEGGDTWYYDPQTPVHEMFSVNAVADGNGDLATINGQTGTFTEDMTFNYTGDNNWIDRISPMGGSELILQNQSPVYGTAIAYDEGNYKTIASSHEFGGLTGSDTAIEELMEEYLKFFDVISTDVVANFQANITETCQGMEVVFTDFSAGLISEWYWEFPGGEPATSNEQNPTVIYLQGGSFDVSLTVTGENGSHTNTKQDYITCMEIPEQAGDISGNSETCQGYEEIYLIDAVANAETYNWTMEPEEAGTMEIQFNQVVITFSESYEGQVLLKVCGENQCGEGDLSADFWITVNVCTGIDGMMTNTPLSVFPNPSSGEFSLLINTNDILNLTILNATGEELMAFEALNVDGHFTKIINMKPFANGIYYLKLEGIKTNIVKKIVISR